MIKMRVYFEKKIAKESLEDLCLSVNYFIWNKDHLQVARKKKPKHLFAESQCFCMVFENETLILSGCLSFSGAAGHVFLDACTAQLLLS